MKRWFPQLVLILAGVASIHAETVQDVYVRGVRAMSGGDTETAKILFAQVLEADPKNKPAAAFLRQIELSANTNADLKKRMERLVVPKVNFRDTSVNAVFDWLPKVAAEQKSTLNIVRLFPKEYGDDTKITLQLSAIPMSNVLEYVSQIGGLKVEYQKNAVVVSLPEKPATATQ